MSQVILAILSGGSFDVVSIQSDAWRNPNNPLV
jgi:hypothetical protein